MAKEPQELKWIEGLLPEEGYRRKAMFGGFAYYIDERMILLIFESKDRRWNGTMFPVDHENQDKALKHFPQLTPHTILPKWLYLPIETENFDDLVTDILEQAIRPTGFWGSVPKPKTKKTKAPKLISLDQISTRIDTRKPRMFSDEPVEVVFQSAKRISDFKNLGPMAEKQLNKAGIKTAQQFIKLGWKKTMVKLIELDPKNRHAMFAYALIGALTNKEWNGISEAEKQEARDYMKELKLAEAAKAKKAKPKKKTAKKTAQKKSQKKKGRS